MDFRSELNKTGFALHPSRLEKGLVDRLRNDCISALKFEDETYHTSGKPEEGRVLFCPRYGSSFTDILDHEIIKSVFDDILGEYILYTMTTSFLPPHGNNGTSDIHRDARHNIHFLDVDIGVMILLDDFNEQNGGTYFLAESHADCKN